MEVRLLEPMYYLNQEGLGLNILVGLAMLALVGLLLWWLQGEGIFGIFGNLRGFLRFLLGAYAWALLYLAGVVAVLSALKLVGLVVLLPRLSILLAMIGGAAMPMLFSYLWVSLRPTGQHR